MMTFSPQKLATYLLLAIYGGIAVLGHGLHELSTAHHHHHDAHEHAADGGCAHHHHGHTHKHTSQSRSDDRAEAFASVHGSLSDGHGHACEICDFLDQNRSFPTDLPVDRASRPLAVAVSIAAPRIESLVIPGLYSPRGPPANSG
jgi:hypothetical protein